MSRAHEMTRKWLQVFGLGPKIGRVQVQRILIKFCLFEPSFPPVLASHTTLLCSVLQFPKHSFWGERGEGGGCRVGAIIIFEIFFACLTCCTATSFKVGKSLACKCGSSFLLYRPFQENKKLISFEHKQQTSQSSNKWGKGQREGTGWDGPMQRRNCRLQMPCTTKPIDRNSSRNGQKNKKSSQLRKPKFILSHIPYVPSLSYKHKQWASHGGCLINQGQQTLWSLQVFIFRVHILIANGICTT